MKRFVQEGESASRDAEGVRKMVELLTRGTAAKINCKNRIGKYDGGGIDQLIK